MIDDFCSASKALPTDSFVSTLIDIRIDDLSDDLKRLHDSWAWSIDVLISVD